MSEQALPEEDRVGREPFAWREWFALLGAAAAWTVHFMASYLLLEVACRDGWQRIGIVGLNGAAAALLLTTLVCLPFAVWSAVVAWRMARGDGAGVADETEEVRGYLGRAGLILGGLFVLAIVAETIPALVLAPCR